MSLPPLGVGYPDGGEVSSLWGNALVAETAVTHNFGDTLYQGYVGNFQALKFFASVQTNNVEYQFLWAVDALFTHQVGFSRFAINTADTSAVNAVIDNQGPYLQISVRTIGVGSGVMSTAVIPVGTRIGADQSMINQSAFVSSAGLAAGASALVTVPTCYPRRATLMVLGAVPPALAVLVGINSAGVSGNYGAVTTDAAGGAFTGNTVVVNVPPCRIKLFYQNSSAGAAQVTAALVADVL